ncbi:MAG TPA: alpha/beta hydrolase-fold protein [Bryobacteraceae bacterium]|jgi:S-formylglutathione hydrolase FrmB|nr:alpha/beta hydrolase-fold protein [Bryobacteraceae bacterium]
MKACILSFAVAFAATSASAAPIKDAHAKGSFERIKVHGKSLEGNLEGDSPDRDVSVYLPPSYTTAHNRRYPVVYLLHGYTNSDEGWFGPNTKSGFQTANTTIPAVADKSLAEDGASEMILVMPNAYTVYQGSMFSNSVTTGDWEGYVTHDLVAYIDSHYRTIATPAGRGLAGHSMGGYGTIRLAMKYPDVYSSIYVLSGCCLTANLNPRGEAFAQAEGVHSQADAANLARGPITMLAEAAAWSPNPKNPPLFFDLPVKDGKVQPAVAARWVANAPLAIIDQYISNLRKLHAIAIDVGDKDGLSKSNEELSRVLTEYGIPNTFEIYDGDHTNHIALRVETKVLPFFSKNLSFDREPRRK